MLPTRSLRKLLQTITLTPFEGTLYRVVRADVLYGFSKAGPYVPRPLYNLGPPRGGARYTPRGGASSIYLACDMDTAMREYTQIPTPTPLDPSSPTGALVTYSVKASLERVLDLSQKKVRKKLETTLAELAEPWRYRKDRRKPLTHRLGAEAADSDRVQAIIFRSTKGTGNCIVIFTEALAPPSFVEVNDPAGKLVERLPGPSAP